MRAVATVYRLLLSYFFALFVALPLALITVSHPKLERLSSPIFDILQSVPALAFFPVIVVIFIRLNLTHAVAIFVLFMAMVWNLVFSMIGGLKNDSGINLKAAAQVFQARGIHKLRFVTLPAIFPYIVTGSLLAWGAHGQLLLWQRFWRSYIPNSSASTDLYGLGSLLVNAAYQGNNLLFLFALIAMIGVISLMNFFIWQKLLRVAERYKFD